MRAARPLGALVLLLAACTAPAAATPSPTPPPPTPPLATPSAAPPASLVIRGDDAFRARTEAALALIRARAPAFWPEVQRELRVIESVPRGSGIDVYSGSYQVGDVTAYAPGWPSQQQIAWYASTVVHDAHHAARFRANVPWAGKEAELACLARQRDALALLDAETTFRTYVQGLIDGADDPANQYWTQPDRHW